MTKYTSYRPSGSETKSREEREKIHPIWRGIGWLLIFIFPVMGYYGSVYLLSENAKQQWVLIPTNILAKGTDPLLYVKIGLTILIVCILFFLFQLISFIILRGFGQERYGPMDIPRVAYRGKKGKR